MRSLLGYLVLDQPRQRYTHWVEALAPLGSPGAPMPLQVDGYFVAAEDRALIGLWYLGGDVEAAALVAEVTRLAEIYVIDPGCLSEPDRRALQDRLAACEVIVDHHHSIVDALSELVRGARELRGQPMAASSSRTITGRKLSSTSGSGEAVSERRASEPRLERVTERVAERGAERAAERAAERVGIDPRAERPAQPRERVAHGSVVSTAEARGERSDGGAAQLQDRGRVSTRDKVAMLNAVAAAPEPPGPRRPLGTRDHVALAPAEPGASSSNTPLARRPASTRDHSAAATAASAAPGPRPAPGPPPAPGPRPADASARDAQGASDVSTPARATRSSVRAPTTAPTDPFLLAFEAATPTITARVLRGQRWIPAQLSQLSLDGAQLASVALPRLGDTVFLTVAFAESTVSARGEVTYLSDDLETAHNGAAQFQVKFTLDEPARQGLHALLLRARAASAQLRPPPRRAARRCAVVWPLMLATPRGSIRAEAFDVSDRGLFVHPLRELELEGNLGFSMVLDDQVTSISARARVVRQVPATEAKQRGLRAGYGLEITEQAEHERLAWERFVSRVRRRGGRRILVGAPAARFEEICNGLLAAGYAVTGGVDLGSVAQLVELERRPVDAAILDSNWMQQGDPPGRPGWMEGVLAARGVPCVTTHGDGRRAYGEIDRLLGMG